MVNFTPRLQMQAAFAAVALTSGLAIGHVAAQPSPVVETPAPDANISSAPAASEADTAPIKLNNRHVTCMAKVVHHEAGNQPREGQIAVAQVLVNRVKQGFGDNVCDVANQPGQFFRLNRYHPNRKSAEWAQAVAIARTVLAGEARDHSRGALYFHANWARPNSFFRGRTKVARLDDHDFYR
jgi:spore germination cell wall hydrolase CwlJ-like protein